MAKKVERKLKLQIEAGKVDPAKVGPALGQAGINIGEFTNQFNSATKEQAGNIVRVEISVYDDRSFDFIIKSSPASKFILKAIGKDKGSGKNIVSKAGAITREQIRAIAEEKMPDLNTSDVEQAAKIIEGTARSMGVEVK